MLSIKAHNFNETAYWSSISLACGTNFRRTEDTEPSLEDLETSISRLTTGPREPKRRSTRLLDLIQRVRINMPPPNPLEVESTSSTISAPGPQSYTRYVSTSLGSLSTSLGPLSTGLESLSTGLGSLSSGLGSGISGMSNTDRLGQLRQGMFSSRPSSHATILWSCCDCGESGMTVRLISCTCGHCKCKDCVIYLTHK